MSAAFDMRAWMRGELPFYAGKTKGEPEPSVPTIRYYGVFMTKRGLRTFVTKNREAVPGSVVEFQETTADAHRLADELLKKYDPNMRSAAPKVQEPESDTSLIGRIGVHADGDAIHTAICVGMHRDECMLLFLTSHPSWNPYVRAIKKDEAPFTGFRWNATTFLAPVLRPPRNLHWRDRYLPSYRVDALREEFFKAERLDLIARL